MGRTVLQPIHEPRPAGPRKDLKGLDSVAWLMDRAVRVPGTPFTVGLDALLGLLPVGGDVLTGLVQVAIVLVAVAQYRVPRAVAARMAANVLLDVAVGAVPLVGDVFDAGFKANTRNLKLLRQVEDDRERGRSDATRGSWLFLTGLVILLVGSIALVAIGFVTVVFWVARQFQAA